MLIFLIQLPSWRITPCQLSAADYSGYSNLSCISRRTSGRI